MTTDKMRDCGQACSCCGEYQSIADYCADDVRIVRAIYKIMIG